MARSISKGIAASVIHVFDPSKDFDIDGNGMPLPNVFINCDGKPSPNKARIIAERECKTKNIMVLDIVTDETKLTISPDVFIANSKACENGVSYGHDTIVQTFKTTTISGFYMNADGMKPFIVMYVGTTTQNKLLNFVRDEVAPNAVITRTDVMDCKRWMSKARFMELAK